jgi:chemotaxis signal transduction protein
MTAPASFVLFPLGAQRFALPSDRVAELARPGRLCTFPHTSPRLTGVLVRRGRIVPVCDVAEILVGADTTARRFYLIANRRFATGSEWTAIPVSGECELVIATILGENHTGAGHVLGYVSLPPEPGKIPVLDLEKLLTAAEQPLQARRPNGTAEARR